MSYAPESWLPYAKDALVVAAVSLVIAVMVYYLIERFTNYFDR